MNIQSAIPFRPDALVVEGDQVHLLGSRCDSCGSLAFPPRKICAACGSADLSQQRLDGKGRLYTYAIVRQAPKEFPTPYVIGYVDLDERVRVFTRVLTASEQNLRLGMRMALQAAPLPGAGDTPLLAYAFTPEGEE